MDKNWREEEQQMIAKRHEMPPEPIDDPKQEEWAKKAHDERLKMRVLQPAQKKNKYPKANPAPFFLCLLLGQFAIYIGVKSYGLPDDSLSYWQIFISIFSLFCGLFLTGFLRRRKMPKEYFEKPLSQRWREAYERGKANTFMKALDYTINTTNVILGVTALITLGLIEIGVHVFGLSNNGAWQWRVLYGCAFIGIAITFLWPNPYLKDDDDQTNNPDR